jgi:hypothetical protein
MYKYIIGLIVICLISGCVNKNYSGDSTGVVTIVGAHIKARDVPVVTNYKRKDCPVCKGTGKYLSGDGIKEVDCGYCEP